MTTATRTRTSTAWFPVGLALFVVAWGGNQFTPLMVMYRELGGFSLGDRRRPARRLRPRDRARDARRGPALRPARPQAADARRAAAGDPRQRRPRPRRGGRPGAVRRAGARRARARRRHGRRLHLDQRALPRRRRRLPRGDVADARLPARPGRRRDARPVGPVPGGPLLRRPRGRRDPARPARPAHRRDPRPGRGPHAAPARRPADPGSASTATSRRSSCPSRRGCSPAPGWPTRCSPRSSRRPCPGTRSRSRR